MAERVTDGIEYIYYFTLFKIAGVKVERSTNRYNALPTLRTLKKIYDSGLLEQLSSIRDAIPDAIIDVWVAPGNRHDYYGNSLPKHDKFVIDVDPEKTKAVVESLVAVGFSVQTEDIGEAPNPYFFNDDRSKGKFLLQHDVQHNTDSLIADFFSV